MYKLLMSINPQYVEKILNGTKRFEFRKVKCKKEIESILIYSTFPVMKIVAEAKVTEIIEDTPQNLWQRTSDQAGIDRSFFEKYYSGKTSAVAYALGKIKKFARPRTLNDYNIHTAPQSYVYIK